MRTQSVRSRQINKLDCLVIGFELTNMAFDRYTRIIADPLPQSGQAIKQGAFARIWTADNRNAGIGLPASWNIFEEYAGFGGFSHRCREGLR